MASTSNDDQTSSNNLSDWQCKLNAFTLHFIQKFVPELNVYKNDAGTGKKQDKKEINNEIEIVGDVINACAEASVEIPRYGKSISEGLVVGNIIASTGISAYKDHTHTKKSKNISKIFREIGDESLRLILIEACGDIFFSFQNQFTKVTDNSTKDDLRGMEKLANDAVNRTFNYISKNPDEDYHEAELHHFITKGVIFGESKRESIKNFFKRSGHTTDLFENVFILKNSDNNAFEHYILSGKKEKDIIYGCRLPFEWEIDELDSDNSVKYIKLTNKISEEKFEVTKEVIFEYLKTHRSQILKKDKMQMDNNEDIINNIFIEIKNIPDKKEVSDLLKKMEDNMNKYNQTRFTDIENKLKNIEEILKQILKK